jgi:hypothetical protein
MDTNLVFCIEHQDMTHMECGELCGHIHYVPVYDDNGIIEGVDVEFCDYPLGFAFVPPPADEPDWIEHVVEPGEEALEPEKEPYFDLSLPEEYIASVMYHKGLGV